MADEQQNSQQNPQGFGVLLLLGLVIGLAVGLFFREPSLGAVTGLVIGTIAAFLFWWRKAR